MRSMSPIRILAILLCWATAASAQIVTTSERLARTSLRCDGAACESPVSVLSRHFTHGDIPRMQRYGAELLQTLARSGPTDLKTALGDVERNYYRFVWVCRDDAGTTSLQSFVVHLGEDGIVRTLPGITSSSRTQLIDVFISTDPTAVLESQYVSTPVKDPLAAQIPGFIEKTGLIGFLAGLPLARGEETAGAHPAIVTTYAVSKPRLPVSRADLKIRDTVIVPGSVSGVRSAAEELARRLSARDVRLSSCGQALAHADADAVAKGLASTACTARPGQEGGLTASEVGHCRGSLLDAVAEAFTAASTCRDTPPAPGEDPLLVVDKQFTDLLGTMRESRRTAEWKLTNAPRTRYSFGVLSAAILGRPHYTSGTVRSKIGSNGSIVIDPMPTLLTMALVNIHVRPYDSQADSVTWAERFRLFAGTTITPDFGLGGGAGVMIVRGLTADVGFANLFVRSPREGFKVGQTPPAGSSPFSAGNARAWFAGLSYSFK